MILLNPNQPSRRYADARSAEVMRETIAFFEAKGKDKLLADYYDRVWYSDFLEFVKANRIFATMCTPAGEGAAPAAVTGDAPPGPPDPAGRLAASVSPMRPRASLRAPAPAGSRPGSSAPRAGSRAWSCPRR